MKRRYRDETPVLVIVAGDRRIGPKKIEVNIISVLA